MALIVNKPYKVITDALCDDVAKRGFTVDQAAVDDPCECTHKETGLRFSFEADSVMDDVSMVTFLHISGNPDETHDVYCDIAAEFKEVIQSKQPMRRSGSTATATMDALEADLKRVSEEAKR